MRILHVVEPLATGINTFILQLTQNIDQAEHTILHGIRKESRAIDSIKKEYPSRVKFIHWENAQREIRPFQDFNAFHELKRVILELKPDIIHLHSTKAGILGRIVGGRIGFKNIVYTPNAVSFLRKDVGKIKIFAYEFIEKAASLLPGTVISSSDCELTAFQNLKIKSKLIFNGAKIVKKEKEKSSIFKVVNCGVASIQKNPEFFNRIAKHYKDNSEIQFYWIGNGDTQNKLTSPNVKLTGWKSKDELFQILFNADIYLSTSLWEGLPLAGIEAMGSGLPLVLKSGPGNDNLVEEGQNGFLYNTELEAIELIDRLMSNREALNSLGKASKQLYQDKFTDTLCSENYYKLYLSLLS